MVHFVVHGLGEADIRSNGGAEEVEYPERYGENIGSEGTIHDVLREWDHTNLE